MWLLDTKTMELHRFSKANIPPYAILSHQWSDSEISFDEVKRSPIIIISKKPGFRKVASFCDFARKLGYRYGWVDTACIDQQSSSELSEAINSMYMWYRDAGVCVIYLQDVPGPTNPGMAVNPIVFQKSKWFERGWTLQELIAPKRRIFLANDFTIIQENEHLVNSLSYITRIDKRVLLDGSKAHNICVAERMSWA